MQQLREFVDVFVGTMLFFVYTIRTSLAYVRSELYKGVGKAVFCACCALKGAFVLDMYWRFDVHENAFDDDSINPANNLLSPQYNDPFYRNRALGTLLASTPHKVYAFCFVVVCSLCGFIVLSFYTPQSHSAEDNGYRVGSHCPSPMAW
ncbi:hypothetical protein T492DRAFT_863239 [Pavlovales sp. CCMP2436]|nr:hypothetical protein T492DRAFT_863239 [Pavlovales sp. CCMP2436]